MKLSIFIPAYNEADTIGGVLAEIPRKFPGVDEVKVFVVDDGSSDGTAAAVSAVPTFDVGATSHVGSTSKVEIVRISPNQGLANAFRVGLKHALQTGADLIVHLDADGQYDPQEIPKLLAPLQQGKADMVTGDRQIRKCAFLGPARVYGNIAGSWFLRAFTGVKVKDASCGFRAYNRSAAQKLEVHSTHTYTHETLIEARYKGLRVAEVPITFRRRGKATPASAAMPTSAGKPSQKPVSRLTKGLHRHIFKSLRAILEAKKRYAERA